MAAVESQREVGQAGRRPRRAVRTRPRTASVSVTAAALAVAVLATAALAAASSVASVTATASTTVPAGTVHGAAPGMAADAPGAATATATVGDLVATISVTGSLQAVSRESVVHGWSAAAPTEAVAGGAATGAGSGEVSGSAEEAATGEQAAAGEAGTELAGGTGDPVPVLALGSGTVGGTGVLAVAPAESTGEPTAEPTGGPSAEPTDEPTAEPTGEPTGGPTDEPTHEPSSEPTGEPTGGPTDAPTDSPTDAPTAGPTGEPTHEPVGEPTAGPTGSGPPAASGTGQPDDISGRGALGDQPGAGDAGRPAGGDQLLGSPDQGSLDQAPLDQGGAVVTALAPLGEEVVGGTVLYEADGEPVVAVLAEASLWRAMELGTTDGPDVAVLEQLLVDLGYGDGLVVDETFDDATAAAVETWETDLGRPEPDGLVELGDLVVVTGCDSPVRVTAHQVQLGEQVRTGSPVLDLGADATEIVLSLDPAELSGWEPGTTVELGWPDGSSGAGTVAEVGRAVTEGTVEVVVRPTGDAASALVGSAVAVSVVSQVGEGVLSVPVSAVVADASGEPVVRRLDEGSGLVEQVPVTLGVVADGRVAVVGALDEGDTVVLPG